MNNTLYVVGYCSSCGTGPVGVRVCGGCGKPLALCEECEAVWLSAEMKGRPKFLAQPHLPCPGCHTSLWDERAHWASYFELERIGWDRYIIDIGRPLSGGDGSLA